MVKKAGFIVGAILVLPIFAAAFLSGIGFNDEPMKIMQKPKFTPLALNPTAGFATHRMPGMACTHIMRVRRVVAGDEVDVYDFQQNTSNYKLTSGGSWIDGSGETFHVTDWYDQTGNGNYLRNDEPTVNRQPLLLLNSNNGWPVVEYRDSGADVRHLYSAAGKTLADYINADVGNMITYCCFLGSSASKDIISQLPTIVGDSNNRFEIYRGIYPIGGDDRIWIHNYDGNTDLIGLAYSTDTWYVIANSHQNGELKGFVDGQLQNAISSGNTSDLSSGILQCGENGWPASHIKQEMFLMFDIVLSDSDHLRISNYCKRH